MRLCSHDRVDLGLSYEGPLPSDLDAHVADLHGLFEAAELPMPARLVGHSHLRICEQHYLQQGAGPMLAEQVPANGEARELDVVSRRQLC